MKTIYTYGLSRVVIENGIVIESDTEFCPIGKKPNLDFLRRCCWKKLPNSVMVTDIFGGKRTETIYR